MGFKDLFEVKVKKNENNLYGPIANARMSSPQYSTVNYKTIADEGYQKNWIIFRCVQEIIKSAIQLKYVVKKRNSKGDDIEIPNHPIKNLLENPNPLYGQTELIKRAVGFYYIGGEAPFVKATGYRGDSKHLYTYRPDRIRFKSTGDVTQPYDNITYNAGNEQPIDSKKFMLWKNFNPLDEADGLGHGMSMLQPVLRNGDLLNALMDWNFSLLKNGGHLSGVVTVDPQAHLSDKEFNRSKAEIANEHQGKDNVGKILLLDGGGKYSQVAANPKDMDWTEGKLSVMKDICVGIGLDPILIGFNEQSSYDNKNEALKSLYTNTTIPLMQELCDQLGLFLGLDDNEYIDVKYDHIPVLQEDMKELSDKLTSNNFLTVNKKRAMMGDEKVEGGDIIVSGPYAIVNGKVYLPMNLVPIDEEGNPQNNKPNNSNSGSQSSNEKDDSQDNNQDENKSFMY